VIQVAGKDKSMSFHDFTSDGVWTPCIEARRASNRRHLLG
jgi:hypothetical protein